MFYAVHRLFKLGVHFLFDPVIATFLKLKGELGATGAHDATFVEHMHEIGLDIVKQALIVGNDNGGVALGFKLVDTTGHNSEGIDVQAAVGFVEYV